MVGSPPQKVTSVLFWMGSDSSLAFPQDFQVAYLGLMASPSASMVANWSLPMKTSLLIAIKMIAWARSMQVMSRVLLGYLSGDRLIQSD
jgi:hypothetical protein